MSRAADRLTALDALLGTTSFRGGVVRSRHGVYTDADGLGLDTSLESLALRTSGGDAVGPCTAHRHGKLRGEKRCHGCGRTRNEIQLDEGD
jgi:hypothetical protein